MFNNKINLLKALAILVVASGHLEFALIPMFPPYSFQVILFFFIAGMVFNSKYGFFEFVKRRVKSLMVPYFLYAIFYLGLTAALAPVLGKFWGMPVTFRNEFLMPFLTGHQIDLISPLWFVPQLFISLIVYKIISYIKCSDIVKTLCFLLLALLAVQLGAYRENLYILLALRTMFSLLFIHLGYLYKNKIEGRFEIFTPKIFFLILALQSVLWLTNKDFTAMDGIGLSFILVWGEFDNWIVPVLTSLTGIWMSLFIIEILYDKIKDWKFLHLIGQNTYHIMANHLLVFNIITYSILALKGIPFDIKNNADIYWFYYPLKSTYFYFVIGIFVTTYLGVFLKFLKRRFILSQPVLKTYKNNIFL